MNYIVLDMEWNQPVLPQMTIRKGTILDGEIIQIGAVKLDQQFREVDIFNKRVV